MSSYMSDCGNDGSRLVIADLTDEKQNVYCDLNTCISPQILR